MREASNTVRMYLLTIQQEILDQLVREAERLRGIRDAGWIESGGNFKVPSGNYRILRSEGSNVVE